MMSPSPPVNKMIILRKFQIGSTNGRCLWRYFHPDESKHAQEIIFSHKSQKVIHPIATFNNIPAVGSSCQKSLGLFLDENLNVTKCQIIIWRNCWNDIDVISCMKSPEYQNRIFGLHEDAITFKSVNNEPNRH